MEIYENLKRLEEEGDPIRVGLVGCGQMGSGLVHVTQRIPGMETAAISDIDVNRAMETLKTLHVPESEIRVTDKLGEAEDALSTGKWVITEDPLLLARLPSLDVLVEATGITEVGSKVAWNCILHSKHVVMLNVETDVTVGPLLHRLAENAGCVYTAASGDEPAVCKMLYDFARTTGFDVVCLGKGKNNVIDHEATPDSCREEAERIGMNPKMLASFKDGSKTMVELAAMSNATGLLPDVPGMHGPEIDLPDLNKVFIPEEDGGILGRSGCVDYTTGRVAPGVFAIVTTPDRRIRADMKYVSMGEGPYYTLHRPYHLTSIETPVSIAEAVIYGESTVVSSQLVSEVGAVAKRDLKPDEIVGDIGDPDFFGRTYTYEQARAKKAFPLGIVPGGKVTEHIPKGQLLTEENFTPDNDRFVSKLRRLQDAQLAMD